MLKNLSLPFRKTFLPLLSSILFVASVWAADPATEARKAIEAAYSDSTKLLASKNVEGLKKYYAKDFLMIDATGKKYPAGLATAQMRQMLERMSNIKYSFQIEEFTYKANTATVVLFESTKADMKDASGKTRKFAMEYKARDYWVTEKGKWVTKQSRELEQQVTLDGQPMAQ